MRITGIVKWFDGGKGYGFITASDGKDYFCHFSVIKMEGYRVLRQGDRVEFDIVQKAKGPVALDVVKLPNESVISKSLHTAAK